MSDKATDVRYVCIRDDGTPVRMTFQDLTTGHELTGFFVRAMRDGKPHTFDISELTDDELKEFFARGLDTYRNDPQWVVNWAVSLAGWIRDHVAATSSRTINPDITQKEDP